MDADSQEYLEESRLAKLRYFDARQTNVSAQSLSLDYHHLDL